MEQIQINDTEKVIRAAEGKVLSNGGEFANYPIELTVNMNDDSWFEIDAPEVVEEFSGFENQPLRF